MANITGSEPGYLAEMKQLSELVLSQGALDVPVHMRMALVLREFVSY
jgi:hypothetical protein